MKFPLAYDNKLDEITRRISILEQKVSNYETNVNSLKTNSHTAMQPQPPPPNPSQVDKTKNQRTENKPPPRTLIINELKEIFRMREGKKKDSDTES